MKNLLAIFMLFGLILNHSNTYSQTSPEYSDAQKICKDCFYQGYLVLANGDVLYIQQRFPDLKLFVYDSDLKFIRKGKIRIRDTWKAVNLGTLGGDLYISYSKIDKGSDSYLTALQRINISDFELVGEEKVIETIPLQVFKDNRKIDEYTVDFVPTPVYRSNVYNIAEFVLVTEIHDDTLVVSINDYFGNEFKQIFYDKNLTKIDQTTIDYVGEPDFTGLNDKPEKVYSSDGVHYGYFTYDDQTYSECFHTYMKKDGEVENYYTHCWDKSWVWAYSGEKLSANYNKAVSKGTEPPKLNFMMNSAVEFKDGSVTYFLDQNYYLYKTNTNTINDLVGNLSTFGNIAVLHYDNTGELEWKKIIPKHQYAYPISRRLSFRTIKMEDESVVLIYSDLGEEKGTIKLNVLSVTPEGDVDTILDYKIPKGTFIRFVDGSQTSDSFYYMIFKSKNDQGLFRVPIQ